MDIFTPKGQESLEQERKLLASFCAATNYSVIETDKNQPAQVDGFIVNDGVLCGVFESKCRKADVAKMHKWGDEWILTHQKLLDGAEISKRLCTPFYGIVYLLDEPIGIFIKLTDSEGKVLPKVRVENTETQATINGGTVVRANAYIDLSPCLTFPII